jgi:hypothetical protein
LLSVSSELLPSCDQHFIQLQAANPGLFEEELFQKARLVVSATIAKIHTLEWTPTILGLNPVLSSGMDINWHGLSSDLPIPSGFVTGILQVTLLS